MRSYIFLKSIQDVLLFSGTLEQPPVKPQAASAWKHNKHFLTAGEQTVSYCFIEEETRLLYFK